MEINDYQKYLLNNLDSLLRSILLECYRDYKFEDIMNLHLLETDVDKVIHNISKFNV